MHLVPINVQHTLTFTFWLSTWLWSSKKNCKTVLLSQTVSWPLRTADMRAHTRSHTGKVQRNMCGPNQQNSVPCCLGHHKKMFSRQAWKYAKHGHGWDEKRKHGQRGERKRGSSGFPNLILLYTCLLLLLPCIRKCLIESLIHRFLRLSSPLFRGLLAWHHFLDGWDHFQTCAVMCAELGVVEPPICWLLYPIMPFVL